MESQDYEHHRNLTLMFFFEKLLEKGGERNSIFIKIKTRVLVLAQEMNLIYVKHHLNK